MKAYSPDKMQLTEEDIQRKVDRIINLFNRELATLGKKPGNKKYRVSIGNYDEMTNRIKKEVEKAFIEAGWEEAFIYESIHMSCITLLLTEKKEDNLITKFIRKVYKKFELWKKSWS